MRTHHKRLPKKWSPNARRVFDHVFDMVRVNQRVFTHPKMPPMPKDQWSTIAWNTAWIAAEAADGRK